MVVEQLLAAGHKVRGAARRVETVVRAFGGGVDPVMLDLTNPGTCSAAFEGVEQVFLLRPPQVGKPKAPMIPALEYAHRLGVRQMVFLFLQGAENNKVVPHTTIEACLRPSDVDWTAVRASFFHQKLSTTHLTGIRGRAESTAP